MSTPTQVELDGHTYKGDFDLVGGILTVRYKAQQMTREIGRTPPGVAAKVMLEQLVKREPAHH